MLRATPGREVRGVAGGLGFATPLIAGSFPSAPARAPWCARLESRSSRAPGRPLAREASVAWVGLLRSHLFLVTQIEVNQFN